IAVVDEGRALTGRGKARAGEELPPLTAEGIVGGVLSILHTRLLASPSSLTKPFGKRKEDQESLQDLAGPLMSMIVSPYLGPAAARRELARPAPKRKAAGRVTSGDPLRE